jgi:hypothetical protein
MCTGCGLPAAKAALVQVCSDAEKRICRNVVRPAGLTLLPAGMKGTLADPAWVLVYSGQSERRAVRILAMLLAAGTAGAFI